MHYAWRLLLAGLLPCLLAAFSGCGGNDLATVRGQVTLDGKPIESGLITFLPVDGKGASGGAKIVNGQYETQLDPGEKTVSILAERVTETHQSKPGDPAGTIEIKQQYLPAKYNTATTLKATITPGKATVDFKLTLN